MSLIQEEEFKFEDSPMIRVINCMPEEGEVNHFPMYSSNSSNHSSGLAVAPVGGSAHKLLTGYVLIFGPFGVGKTTLLSLITGMTDGGHAGWTDGTKEVVYDEIMIPERQMVLNIADTIGMKGVVEKDMEIFRRNIENCALPYLTCPILVLKGGAGRFTEIVSSSS